MRQFFSLIFALALLPLYSHAQDVTVFNNFGPNNTYITNNEWQIGGPPDGSDGYATGYAAAITPSQTVSLTTITLVLGHFWAENTFTVAIYNDAANQPGTPLESFTLNNLVGSGPTLLTITSGLHTILTAGVQYWVGVTVPSRLQGGGWYSSLSDRAGLWAQYSVFGQPGWHPGSLLPPGFTRGVFSVMGTPTGSPPCTGVNIDQSQANGQLDISLTGSCDAVLTIRNKKNYWTNVQLSPTGSATITPVGGGTNLYAQAGLLPPSGLVGSSTAVMYNIHFSRPRETISIFVDPTGQTGNGYAKYMNLVQIVLNAVRGGSAATLAITEYQQVAQAFAQMPHFSAAAEALFSNPLSLGTFFIELGRFVTSLDELATFVSLIQSIDISLGSSVIKTVLGAPWRVLNTIISVVGNVIDFTFRYPTGSVLLTAQ